MPDEDLLASHLAHITSAYRRALWIVVLLNVGYGIFEIIGVDITDKDLQRFLHP